MATGFVTRKRFRVAPMLQHATTMLTRRTMMVHVPNWMLAVFAEAMASRLAHAIVPATCSTSAASAEATASPMGLAIVRATCSTSAASAEAMASPMGLVIALAICWMPAVSAAVQV